MPLSCPHVRQALGGQADRPLLPPPLALSAIHETCPGEDQGPDRSKPRWTAVRRRHCTSEPVSSGMGQLLPHRERGHEVRIPGPLCGMAAEAPLGEEAWPQPAYGTGSEMDPHLVPRPGSASAHGHYPLSESCVTMPRRPSVSCMRENRTYRSKGGWGNRLALRVLPP